SAIASFIFEAGMLTVACRAMPALRMRVNISPIGSFTLTRVPPHRPGVCAAEGRDPPVNDSYQLDLTTPGIRPLRACSRKQMRHMPNLRMYARERPQTLQRLYSRTLNFAGRDAFTIHEVLANADTS